MYVYYSTGIGIKLRYYFGIRTTKMYLKFYTKILVNRDKWMCRKQLIWTCRNLLMKFNAKIIIKNPCNTNKNTTDSWLVFDWYWQLIYNCACIRINDWCLKHDHTTKYFSNYKYWHKNLVRLYIKLSMKSDRPEIINIAICVQYFIKQEFDFET